MQTVFPLEGNICSVHKLGGGGVGGGGGMKILKRGQSYSLNDQFITSF